MLTYNTQEKPLKLPEYGRTIQRMVDYCITIEDREERNLCAATIVDTMMRLLPSQPNSEETMRKLWDHLLIMSDYKLDIDAPYETVKAGQFEPKPEPISYRDENFRFRHYGRFIERMIATAITIEDSEARLDLAILIANQMKKMMLEVTNDVEDSRIFSDLAVLSKGEIRLSAEEVVLNEYIPAPSSKKKKKK